MPRAPPQNLSRSFNTRCTGIFKKAAELHQIDDRVRVSIVVEKPGVAPLVFTTDERGHNWPPFVEDYVKRRHPLIKRPSHYQSVIDGISRGHVQVVCTSSLSPPPPYIPENTTEGGRMDMEENMEAGGFPDNRQGLQQLGEGWYVPMTPPRPMPSRTSTSSPLPTNLVLPSKMNTCPK